MVNRISRDIGWHRITQHIRCGLTPSPFGTLLPTVATSYMLETLGEMLTSRQKIKTVDDYYLRKEVNKK
jgi:hypothetical protein